MWQADILPDALEQAFTEPPPEPIWQWADKNVWLGNKEAAAAGPYRSSKTPWTRRIQEIGRHPYTYIFVANSPENAHLLSNATSRLIASKKWDGYWLRVRVAEFNVQKSSQSGFSEAILNIIRWRAKYRPCNTIYAIDTKEEAKNISERLLPSLEAIDANIFTGDDGDVGTYVMRLRAMELWFMGSFSSGKFANKQAPFCVADEYEEHGTSRGDTSSGYNLKSRKKTADEGLQCVLSKPKLENGPINKLVKKGNQEMFFVPCPHCKTMQTKLFDIPDEGEELVSEYEEENERIHDPVTGEFLALGFKPLPPGQTRVIKTGHVVFKHCKDALGKWDQLRLLEDTYYECASCKEPIRDHHKQWMNDRGEWWPTSAHGESDVISQYFSDLFSTDKESTYGKIAKEFVSAKKAGRAELQGVVNHRFGKAFKQELSKTDEKDIKANIVGKEGDAIPAYNRGKLSFEPWQIILGSDVGGNYARWATIAVLPNQEDVAVLDWGDELAPLDVARVQKTLIWPGPNKTNWRTGIGFMDQKFRTDDVYKACRDVPGRVLIPYSGLGGASARSIRMWAFVQIQTYEKGFCRLDVNDREAKNELYITYIKKKHRRIYFPSDVMNDPVFVSELCAEELTEDENGQFNWNERPGPNHYGDCIKIALMGLKFITRRETSGAEPEKGVVAAG